VQDMITGRDWPRYRWFGFLVWCGLVILFCVCDFACCLKSPLWFCLWRLGQLALHKSFTYCTYICLSYGAIFA